MNPVQELGLGLAEAALLVMEKERSPRLKPLLMELLHEALDDEVV